MRNIRTSQIKPEHRAMFKDENSLQ